MKKLTRVDWFIAMVEQLEAYGRVRPRPGDAAPIEAYTQAAARRVVCLLSNDRVWRKPLSGWVKAFLIFNVLLMAGSVLVLLAIYVTQWLGAAPSWTPHAMGYAGALLAASFVNLLWIAGTGGEGLLKTEPVVRARRDLPPDKNGDIWPFTDETRYFADRDS